jgi:hypothetical protein
MPADTNSTPSITSHTLEYSHVRERRRQIKKTSRISRKEECLLVYLGEGQAGGEEALPVEIGEREERGEELACLLQVQLQEDIHPESEEGSLSYPAWSK